MNPIPDENAVDDGVEDQIQSCLDLEKPKSFFLYAGAGSGKTRSLVNSLRWIRQTYGRRLWLQGQRIGVITYTNAACDEIKERMEFNILFEVSTIHSFAWSLIGSYQTDIRNWLRGNLAKEIDDLQAAQAKGKIGTKAAIEREIAIRNKAERLAYIETVKAFQYSPTSENRGRDALSHAEVINMIVAFLADKSTLQNILVRQYPMLLVDESQDTNRLVMDALLALQQKYHDSFCLGLFGDTMQRIYADGKVGLEAAIPADWTKPKKKMNHRCPHRILQLLNKMRNEVDQQEQKGRTDKPDGYVRLFLLPTSIPEKIKAESEIAQQMAAITGDESWNSEYKALILEHHMAARRLGFSALFDALYKVDRLRQGLLDGSLPGLKFFSKQVFPVVEAMRRHDRFAATAIVRAYSPFFDVRTLKTQTEQFKLIGKAKAATESLMTLFQGDQGPSFGEVLDSVFHSCLFDLPDTLRIVASRRAATPPGQVEGETEVERDEALVAWDAVMPTPFEQIAAYSLYVSGASPFDTHQGIKGREFPRVMVVIDDQDARGFMFNYEKLFGVEAKSTTDLKNEREGLETTIDRTRRLLYVTCSRAENSLAIVNYTADPAKAKANVLSAGWFSENEIIVLS